MSSPTLNVVVTSRDFTFVLAPGQRLVVADPAAAQLEKHLIGHQCAVGQGYRMLPLVLALAWLGHLTRSSACHRRFPLSDSLALKVAEDQAHQETSKGWW